MFIIYIFKLQIFDPNIIFFLLCMLGLYYYHDLQHVKSGKQKLLLIWRPLAVTMEPFVPIGAFIGQLWWLPLNFYDRRNLNPTLHKVLAANHLIKQFSDNLLDMFPLKHAVSSRHKISYLGTLWNINNFIICLCHRSPVIIVY